MVCEPSPQRNPISQVKTTGGRSNLAISSDMYSYSVESPAFT